MKTLIAIGVIVILALIFLYPGKGQLKALYVVDETEQVIITRFGEVKSVKTSSGLNFKLPFVDTVITFDRRILRIDAPPVAMPDKEKQNLIIDSYARYRIVDPVQFRKTLQTENNARSRLGDIVTSALRAQIALRDRNQIIGARPVLDAEGKPEENEEGLPRFEGTESRTILLREVVAGVTLRVDAEEKTEIITVPDLRGEATFSVALDQPAISGGGITVTGGPEGDVEGLDILFDGFDAATNTVTFAIQEDETVSAGTTFTLQYFVERQEPLGIEIVDVRIKRADFPGTVTDTIFTRMRAERNRIATKFRSEGDEEDLKIRAEANKNRTIILADADRESNQVRGAGEAEAIRILAEALEEDPEFFAFRRSLEAYARILNQGTTVILSADADLFRFLDSPGHTASE